MSTKKTAPRLATESGLCAFNTLSQGKDRDYSALFQRVRQQEQKIAACLAEPTEKGKTRMRIALETGIERANVCRRVAQLREQGRIWSCGRHLDSITGCRAEFLTTDRSTAFEYYLRATASIWAALPTEDERREMWDAVKAAIDKEAGR